MKRKNRLFLSTAFIATLSLLAINSHTTIAPILNNDAIVRRADSSFLGLAPLNSVTLKATDDPSSILPLLPTTVKGYYSDGTSKDFNITWETPSSSQTSTAGTFLLAGSADVDGEAIDVTISITIVTLFDVFDPSVTVVVDTVSYELPSETYAIYSDGSTEKVAIEYDESLPSTTEKGDYQVSGHIPSLDDYPISATVHVIGVESLPSKNIADEASPSISFSNSYDDPAIFNDGAWDTKGLSNWEHREDVLKADEYFSGDLTFNEVKENITSVIVYYWTGESNCELPVNHKLEIDDGSGTFVQPEYTLKVGSTTTNSVTPYTYVFSSPISVKAVRANWNMSDSSGYQGGKWCNVSEIQVLTPSGEVSVSQDNTLEDVRVNGKSITNFDGFQSSHTTKVPYATTEVTIDYDLTSDKSYATVIPGAIDGEPYRIIVADEGMVRAPREYSIFVRRDNPLLKSVSLSLEGGVTSVKEGSTIPLVVEGTDEIGGEITSSQANVSYNLENLSGQAEVRGNELYCSSYGYVRLTATMTYNNTAISSSPLLITIEKSDQVVTPVSAEKTETKVISGGELTLPETVEVTMSDGSVRDYPVAWNSVPESFLESAGTFDVQGYVSGTTLLAECSVTVIGRDLVSYSSSLSAPVGSTPVLPSELPYYQDTEGNITYQSVVWDSSRFYNEFAALTEGQYVDAWYYFSNESNQWRTVRYYAVTGGTESVDYADRQNGYMIPASFASYSAEGSDMAFSDAKNASWISSSEDENPYIGFVFGDNGNVETREVNKAVIDFVTDGYDLPSDITVQYYSGSISSTDLDTNNFANVEDSTSDKLKLDDSGWRDVTNLSGTISEETILTFDSVTTSAIRILFEKDAAATLNVNDLSITGEVYEVQKTVPTLSSLNVTIGSETVDLLQGGELQDSYSVDYDGTSEIAITPIYATGDYGSYTILGDTGDNTIYLTLISEDGSETRTIAIHLNKPESEYKVIASVTQPTAINVESAKDSAALNLPSTVLVSYTDGTSEEVGVIFDTSSFSGKAGNYLFQGTIDRPLDASNPLNLKVVISVTVAKDYVSEPSEPTDPSDPSDPSDPEPNEPKDEGLGQGDIAAITLGTILGVILIAGGVYLVIRLVSKKKSTK